MSFPPLLFALLMWFAGTGAIVWLDSRPVATFRRSFSIAGVASVGAAVAVALVAGDGSVTGAYIGFAAAIVIWGWHEMGFLMGFVAGPRRIACAPDARGWARFRMATATVIHHEIALAATAALLFALCWGSPNQAAPLSFLLLFVMRLSAKLNLFLGVPNLSDEVFPAHLDYLKSYFRKSRANALMPFSLVFAAGLTGWAWMAAERATTNGGAATGTLLAGLAFLGLVEHLFLILPMRDARMWGWAANKPANAVITRKNANKGIATE